MKTWMLPFAVTGLLASVGVVSPLYAQERSSGGTLEVQTSYSALKAAINNLDIIARGAEAKADEAWSLALKMRDCSKLGRFYDDSDPTRDAKDCVTLNTVEPTDDDAMRASVVERDFDESNTIIDVPRTGSMMMSFSCVASSNGELRGVSQRILGDDGRSQLMYTCENTGDKNWDIDFGTGTNGWKNGYSGTVSGFGPATSHTQTEYARDCQRHKTIARNLFVYEGRLYNGSVIMTPTGTRVLDKFALMSAPEWNGKMRFKNCDGSAKATYYK